MILHRGAFAGIAALALFALTAARAAEAPKPDPAALDSVRQQCVAAARDTQERERAVAALQHRIDLRRRDAAATKRDIDGSRPQQAGFLGAVERLARNLDNPWIGAGEPPADRARSELLIRNMVPPLKAEGHALASEIARIATSQQAIAVDRGDLSGLQTALGQDRDRLAQLLAHRLELTRSALPQDAAAPARFDSAKTVEDLIKLADAATERRDRALVAPVHSATAAAPAATGGDPARPPGLRAFDPPQSTLTPPVSGAISQRFGAIDVSDAASPGVQFATLPRAVVVALFDGRVVYAGTFRNLGLVLIIRHGALYHSLLAGLGGVDAVVGQWVLAGEPVGAMPAAADGAPGQPLYVEFHREGRAVDPQPWLASDEGGRDKQNADEKVRQ